MALDISLDRAGRPSVIWVFCSYRHKGPDGSAMLCPAQHMMLGPFRKLDSHVGRPVGLKGVGLARQFVEDRRTSEADEAILLEVPSDAEQEIFPPPWCDEL